MVAKLDRRVTAIALDLPGASRCQEGEHARFTVRDRTFAWLLDDHHGDGRIALHVKAAPGENSQLVDEDPERFHMPPYLGPKGWVGIWLDVQPVDWDKVESAIAASFALVAPAKLARSAGHNSR